MPTRLQRCILKRSTWCRIKAILPFHIREWCCATLRTYDFWTIWLWTVLHLCSVSGQKVGVAWRSCKFEHAILNEVLRRPLHCSHRPDRSLVVLFGTLLPSPFIVRCPRRHKHCSVMHPHLFNRTESIHFSLQRETQPSTQYSVYSRSMIANYNRIAALHSAHIILVGVLSKILVSIAEYHSLQYDEKVSKNYIPDSNTRLTEQGSTILYWNCPTILENVIVVILESRHHLCTHFQMLWVSFQTSRQFSQF